MKPWLVTRGYAFIALLDLGDEGRLHVEFLELFELDVLEEGVVFYLLGAVEADSRLRLDEQRVRWSRGAS